MYKYLPLFLLSFSLFASEHIGDKVSFDFSFHDKSGFGTAEVMNYNKGYEIDNEFNHDDDKLIKKTKSKIIWSHKLAEFFLKYCTELRGVEDAMSIDGNTYDTCKFSSNSIVVKLFFNHFAQASGDLWIGDFPVYGVAKFEAMGNSLEVTSFDWNKD